MFSVNHGSEGCRLISNSLARITLQANPGTGWRLQEVEGRLLLRFDQVVETWSFSRSRGCVLWDHSRSSRQRSEFGQGLAQVRQRCLASKWEAFVPLLDCLRLVWASVQRGAEIAFDAHDSRKTLNLESWKSLHAQALRGQLSSCLEHTWTLVLPILVGLSASKLAAWQFFDGREKLALGHHVRISHLIQFGCCGTLCHLGRPQSARFARLDSVRNRRGLRTEVRSFRRRFR